MVESSSEWAVTLTASANSSFSRKEHSLMDHLTCEEGQNMMAKYGKEVLDSEVKKGYKV